MSTERQQGTHAKARLDSNAFTQFEIKDYVENPPLIEILRVSVDNAQANIVRLTKSEHALTRERDQLKQHLSEELISHEKTRGDSKESIARLQETVLSLQDQVSELRRLSAVSVVIAWVGTVLVAIGVNLLTGGTNEPLGLTIIISGAAVGIAAFFVRRHSRTSHDRSEMR